MRADVLAGGDVAGDDRRRIAGRQVEQREDEERDHRHDGDGREQPPDDIGEHRQDSGRALRYFFSTFHSKVIGAMISPEMFER